MTNVSVERTTIESLLFAVALAVGIAPELLPAIIAVTLSKGAQRMSEKGVIVRHLNAIEYLGSMDVLCSDKTGTLTEDVIRLEKAAGCDGKENKCVLNLAFLNAHFESGLNNPFDAAIIERAKLDQLEYSSIIKLDEIPYDFIRKRVTIVTDNEQNIHLITNGAFKQVLEMCDFANLGNDIVPVSSHIRKQLKHRFKNWGNEGYRVLAVADKMFVKAENRYPILQNSTQIRKEESSAHFEITT